MSPSANEKIIIAIDTPSGDEAHRLIASLAEEGCYFKVGLQLFTAEGPSIIREIQSLGVKIFLDLKFHDIPNTAKGAIHSVVKLGINMTTIHLAGGPAMVRESLKACEGSSTLLLGVTVLTSMDQKALEITGIDSSPIDQVIRLTKMGIAEGLRGIVASPHEVSKIRETFDKNVVIVTPGVRPAYSEANDQQRVMTPREAIRQGADYLVIGRPITGAPSPREAFLRIADEIAAA